MVTFFVSDISDCDRFMLYRFFKVTRDTIWKQYGKRQYECIRLLLKM